MLEIFLYVLVSGITALVVTLFVRSRDRNLVNFEKLKKFTEKQMEDFEKFLNTKSRELEELLV